MHHVFVEDRGEDEEEDGEEDEEEDWEEDGEEDWEEPALQLNQEEPDCK